jgi:hypothetical protein
MSRDVEVQYAPPFMSQHQEHVQNLEMDGWHGEEIDSRRAQPNQSTEHGHCKFVHNSDLPFSSLSLGLKLVITFIALVARRVKQNEQNVF